MQILRFHKLNKGALQGTFSIMVPKWGIIINDMALFEGKNGARWVSFPQKAIKGQENTNYYPLMQFENKSHQVIFNQKVIDALDEHLKLNTNKDLQEPEQMEMPF